MTDTITFEHPLNERNRTLLRLEQLFIQLQYHAKSKNKVSSRGSITGLLDIATVLGRSDIKSELIKELKRQINSLNVIKSTPGIDLSHLTSILEELTYAHESLHKIHSQLGSEIRKDEFMTSITQRSAIPGGTCAFDLPQYHLWLNAPPKQRMEYIQSWRNTLRPVSNAIAILLRLTRTSVNPSTEIAEQGFFRRSLNTQEPIQIVRVTMPRLEHIYAEISGSKHLVNIRFIDINKDKSKQTNENIEFKLSVCKL